MTMEGTSLVAYLSFETNSWYFDNNRKALSDNFDVNEFCGQTSNNSFFSFNEATAKIIVSDEHYQSSNHKLEVMWRCVWYINCVQAFGRHDLWHVF